MLERSTQDPKIRTAAASALVAGGAIAAAKVVREHAEERRRDKPDAFRFEAGERPRDEIGRIAREQLDLTIGLLEGAAPEEDGGESVHEARKALKRLRALLRVSRGVIESKRYRHENLVLRDVGRALAGTRDAQVLLDTLDALRERYGAELRKGAWSSLRESLSSAAEGAQMIGSEEASSLAGVLSEARGRSETWPLAPNGRPESLAGGFSRIYRRGRRAHGAVCTEQSPETLHELRKRAKDLWHAAQLLEPLCPKQMQQLKRSAHQLSDLLGEDHDLTILREHAEQHSELLSASELELLVALIGCRQQALRRDALACAADIYRPKPKQLLQRLALA